MRDPGTYSLQQLFAYVLGDDDSHTPLHLSPQLNHCAEKALLPSFKFFMQDKSNRHTNVVPGPSVGKASHDSPCADDGSTKGTHGGGTTRAQTLHKQTFPTHGSTTLEARSQVVANRNDDELAADVSIKVRIKDRSSNRPVDESATQVATTAITETLRRSPMSHQAPAPWSCHHGCQSQGSGSEAGSRTGWAGSEHPHRVPVTVRTKGISGIRFPERRPSDDIPVPLPRSRCAPISEPSRDYRVRSDRYNGTRWERSGIKRGASEMRGIGRAGRDSVPGRPKEKVTQDTAAEVLQHR